MRASWRVAAPLILGFVLLAGWWATVRVGGVSPLLLPSPGAVAARLASDLTTPALWPYVGHTLAAALGGCALGTAVALPLAVLVHASRFAEAAVTPFLGATQAIPAIALAPLLVLWIGYGLFPVVVLCAVMVFFPILVSSLVGLRHVHRALLDAARIDGASRWRRLVHIEAPLALPNVLGGLRNGFTLSVTGAVVGEMVMGGSGLGTILTLERESNDTAGMFSTLIVLCALASGIYGLIRLWERRSRVIDSLL